MQCATHPAVETHVRCNQCNKAICFRCMVQTPVGYRCQECARGRVNPLHTLQGHSGKVAGAAIASAVVGGVAWAFSREIGGGAFGFISVLLAMGIGYGIGETVSRAASHRPIQSLRAVVASAAVAAFLVGNVLAFFWWNDLPFTVALKHFYADQVRAVVIGQTVVVANFSISIWGILSGILSAAMAASRIRR